MADTEVPVQLTNTGQAQVRIPFDSSSVAIDGKMKPTNPGIRGRLRFVIEAWNDDAPE
jgi:hypothetical protein